MISPNAFGEALQHENDYMTDQKLLLIRGGYVYDHDANVHKPSIADVLIEGSDIAAVGPNLPPDGVDQILEAHDRLLLPGLIDAHHHSHDTLCRGMFEELPLETWLLYTLPMGANRSKEELRARTLVGAVESLRCGITTVQDMLGLVPLDEASTDTVVEAYRDAGIRVVFSPMVWDIPPIAMVRNKNALPADVQQMLGTTGRPVQDQLDYLDTSSIATNRPASCIGLWRHLRRSAVRRKCCKDVQIWRASTIYPSTPMSTKREAKPLSRESSLGHTTAP